MSLLLWTLCVAWVACAALTPLSARAQGLEEEEEDLVLDPVGDPATSDDPDDPDELTIPDEGDEPVRLKPVNIVQRLQEISKLGGSVQRIGEEQLKALNYDDPQRVVTQGAGVYVRQEDGFGLRPNIGLRGANSERSRKVTLMEDGILFGPAPYSAPAAYFFPMIMRMVGVEVFKGPGSILYGPHTVGGAIDFKTREAPSAGMVGGLDTSLGSFWTTKVHGYGGIGSTFGGLLLEGAMLRTDGFKELDGGGDTGFSRMEFMLKGHLNSDPNEPLYHRVDLKLGFSNERSNETYLGLSDADFAQNPNRRYAASAQDRMTWWRTQGQVSYRLEWEDAFDLTATLYRHDMRRAWRKLNRFRSSVSLNEVLANPTSGRRAVLYDVLTGRADSGADDEALMIGTNDRSFASQGAQVIARHRHSAKAWSNQAEVGVRLHNDWIERFHTEDAHLMRSGGLVAEGTPTLTTTQNRGETWALAVHILDQLSFLDLTLTPGLRVEWISSSLIDRLAASDAVSNTQAVLIPGLGAHYALTPAFGVLAGVHRGFTPVSPGQPQDVEPEFSVNYEAGVRYSIPDAGTLTEVIGFFNDYSNLTGNCGFSSGCSDALIDRQFNAGQVWVYGVEVVAAHTWAASSLRFPTRLAYTFTASEFRTSFESDDPQFGDVFAGDSLPYVPSHQASLQAGVEWAALRANLGFTYVAATREQAGSGDEGPQTDPQYLLDALVSYTFFERFELYTRADNLLNTTPVGSRRPFGARPVRPLMGQVGLRITY
jgi:Fe(3+) dicitrate transport protein